MARVTSADVAREVGVSRATVSYLVNNTPGQKISDETRRKVFEAAERLGYTPNQNARALRLGRSDIVLFPLGDATLSHVFASVINACSAALNQQGFTLVSDATQYSQTEDAADAWLRLTPAAFIDLILPANHAAVAQLERAGIARVTSDLALPNHLSAMDVISVEARKLQLRHLIEKGTTNVVYAALSSYFDGPKSALLVPALQAIAADEGIQLRFEAVGSTSDSLRSSARSWVDDGCDAVCGYSDDIALPILAALVDLGVDIPGQVSVIGVDDIPASSAVTPTLSTVGWVVEELGESLAASVQLAVLDSSRAAQFALPDLRVIERDSTKLGH